MTGEGLGPAGPAADAIKQLAPLVYVDAAQPAVREIGGAIGRAVRMALAPLRAVLWTVEQAESWLTEEVERRLSARGTAEDSVVSPSPQIAAGVIQGVRVSGPDPEPELRDLYAELLASSMDLGTAGGVHPAFASILQQLSPDEAKIVKVLSRRAEGAILDISLVSVQGFRPVKRHGDVTVLATEAGCRAAGLLSAYVNNLTRLGLGVAHGRKLECQSPRSQVLAELVNLIPSPPDRIAENIAADNSEFRGWLARYGRSEVNVILAKYDELCAGYVRTHAGDPTLELEAQLLSLTDFGEQFVRVCVGDDS